ncbi:winged helix-turn-helix domain-containing protein [Actinoplanes sp. LDG1-06]|uniref:Winged helix-turn-helix domain-containing protein n=1 Tax=Paractinoplanes ovalisporus TaxID=2810368 RepID=A0ABS2AID1_9ACTN|nr:BTAD domain-containing putative transcriptional regulator [Actinoplanes ovalisporus]MBM2619604.1 winged helix-turn-helix domain-containing protein [Actinoplanes ovalisporus]
MLTVAVLGPVDLRRDGVRLDVPAGRTTEVLIRLALDAGRPVRAERLIEDLWGGPVSPNVLQAKVSKLRRVLGDAGLVTGGTGGYTLHVEPEHVDALEVLRRTDAGALELFRGDELLPDAGEGEWLAPWRGRLAEARGRLAEAYGETLLDTGDTGALQQLVAAQPLSENLWRLFITALYRDGRQADALDAYRQVRARLADELGLDPGPALRDLERRILVQDSGLAAGNLPARSGPLIGRDGDLRRLGELLSQNRLVTVVGPAGVGKTGLAVETARGRGGWLTRLETTQNTVWQAIGETFALAEAVEPTVLDRLRNLRALLVLDNCEHLADLLGPVVERILTTAPGITVLATSQIPLGIEGETTYGLGPLPHEDAEKLFRERAARHRRLDPQEDVGRVVRRLDGLPLAIELAAARAKALPVREIARRLDDRFTLLADPNSRRPPRQRTLRAALGWSYDLLFPDDQRGLWALATFAAGAPLAAAEHVLAALDVPGPAALDVLDRLVDRSLAVAEVGTDARYRLLDSVRAYGRERLAEAGLTGTAAAAHAAWYGSMAAAADLRGPGQASALAFVRAERADIDAAVAWARANDPGLALRIVTGFGWAWVFLGAGSEAAARSRSALFDGAPAEQRVDALLFAAWFEASGGDLERAFSDVDRARRIAPLPRTDLFLAFLHSQQGQPAAALEALDAFRETATGWEAGAAALLEAWARTGLGDLGRARAACDEALRRLTPLGDAWALSHAQAILGGLAQAEHRPDDAAAHYSAAAEAAHRLGFTAAESLHLTNLGRAQPPAEALETLERAAGRADSVGDLRNVAYARARRAGALRELGRLDEAEAELSVALGYYDDPYGRYLRAALARDVPGLEAVLKNARDAGDRELEMITLAELGDGERP